jgi:hypothetical protein
MCATRRFSSVVALTVFVTGCSTWEPVTVVSPTSGQNEPVVVALDNGRQIQPDRIRVLPSDGPGVVLDAPRVEGDTLHGIADSRPESFALANLRVVEWRGVAVMRTLGLIAAGVLVLLGTHIVTCGDACR